jgi:alpha-tubulin suppressor-like RCC1 family protein
VWGGSGLARRSVRVAFAAAFLVTGSGGVLGVSSGASGVAAAASTSGPTVSGFASTPSSVTTSDGSITLSATVGNASSCTFSSVTTVAGLPATVACTNGGVSTTIALPLNKTTATVDYRFNLAVTGGGGTVNAPAVQVTVAVGAGQPPLKGVTALASTSLDYCGIVTTSSVAGGVDCWGDDSYSELGHGPLANNAQTSSMAVTVASPSPGHSGVLSGATSLAAGENGFCAVVSGKVACWGAFYSSPSVYPAYVTTAGGDLSGIATVVGNGYGESTFCALTSPSSPKPGQVYCWGYGAYGQLGNGTLSSSSPWTFATPVVNTKDTGPLKQVTSLVLGGGLGFCAVVGSSAGLDCWGSNNVGQLGNNSTASLSDLPVRVHGINNSGFLSGVHQAVANGDGNGVGGGVCAVLNTGGVACWGYGANDDLGDNSNAGSPYPVQVHSPDGVATHFLSGATGVATDSAGSCAVVGGGALDCWGIDTQGQLGNNSSRASAIPVKVVGVNGNGTLSGVQSSTSSTITESFSYCVVISGGTADCWGLDIYGETGTGNAPTSHFLNGPTCLFTPTPVVGTKDTGQLKKVKSILGAPLFLPRYTHPYCALLTSGNVDCWGYGHEGELGDGSTAWSAFPVGVFAATG